MKIKDEAAYDAAIQRVLELNPLVDDNTPTDNPIYIELDQLTKDIEEYEEVHYPIPAPTLLESIELRMDELGLNKKNLAKLLQISPARLSAYLSGKREPTLSVARSISKVLDIDPSIVLGVA